jgi:uncharacterized damage-inducible protein DinB
MTPDDHVSLPAPADADYLAMLFGHHVWASLALLDRCAELSPEQLALTTPGVYGTVGATLAHLVRADARYQRRILGEELSPVPRDEPPPTALRVEMERQGARWWEVLARLDELDMTLPAEPDEDPPYPRVEHAVGLVLTQAIHHGNEHRAHVCSILGAHGLPVPEVSGWEHVRVRGGRALGE